MNNWITILLCAALLLLIGTMSAAAQEAPLNGAERAQPNGRSLLAQLELSTEQIRLIRGLNRDSRETRRAANQRVQQARRALDAAIYADQPNESEVEQRARELSAAQTEAVALRAKLEFRIREVLTAEQLVRFRELRAQTGQNLRNRVPRLNRRLPPNRPLRQNPPRPIRNFD